MGLFVIELEFAERLEVSPELLRAVEDDNADGGLRCPFEQSSVAGILAQ